MQYMYSCIFTVKCAMHVLNPDFHLHLGKYVKTHVRRLRSRRHFIVEEVARFLKSRVSVGTFSSALVGRGRW